MYPSLFTHHTYGKACDVRVIEDQVFEDIRDMITYSIPPVNHYPEVFIYEKTDVSRA